MRRKKRKELEAQPAAATSAVDAGFGGEPHPAPEEPRLTPVEVQQVEFRLAFRGYSEQDVDAFLDRISEELARLHEENKRLREEIEEGVPGSGAGALIGDAQRRAESIVREAREQAARLVADPEQAAALAAGAGVASGATAAASDAMRVFLGREREFLQSIASLIQHHAEAVKEDVRRAKEEGEGFAPSAGGPAPRVEARPGPVGSAVATAASAGAAAAIARLRSGDSMHAPAPAPATAARPEPEPAFDDDDPFAAYRMDPETAEQGAAGGAEAEGDDDVAWENPFLATTPRAPAAGTPQPAPSEAAAEDSGEGDEASGEESVEGSAEARRRESGDDGVDTLFWGET